MSAWTIVLLVIIFICSLAYLIGSFFRALYPEEPVGILYIHKADDNTVSLHSVNFEMDGKEGQILTNDPDMMMLLINNRIPVRYTKREEGK